MRSLLFALAAITAGMSMPTSSAVGQDPLVAIPDAYRLEFQNPWVKVVRVTYAPHAVLAPHLHTERASAYVYLNDGGPILFKHEGLPYAGVTRPATTAGSFRVYKGLAEVHSVENPTATRSEFLRVEFLTEPLDEASMKGKFFRDTQAPVATSERTQFENAQVRITRVRVMPGDTVPLAAGAQPALLVALVPTRVDLDGEALRPIDAGKVVWLDSGRTSVARAVGAWSELLRIDFKTPPLRRGTTPEGQEQ